MKEVVRIAIYLVFVFIFLSSKIGFAIGILLFLISFFNIKKIRLSKLINQIVEIIFRKLDYKTR